MEGWIKIHRKLIESNVFDNEKALKVWIWCLLKATHKETELLIGKQVVKLKPGQFVFGREKAAEELKMKPSTVYGYIGLLQNMGNLVTKPNNKFTLVTVVKWDLYQFNGESFDNKITTKEQQNNTYKNNKRINKNIYKGNERKYDKSFFDNLYNFNKYGG